jgi:DNA-binding protein YbaB
MEAGDPGMLEDMILAAVRNAVDESRKYSSSRMRELGLPDAGALL